MEPQITGDFLSYYHTLYKDEVKAHLENLTAPCYESKLLKIAFNDEEVIRKKALHLYRCHFVLYYFLYELEREYAAQDLYLHIHFMRTNLIPYPPAGKCRFYHDESGVFCSEPTAPESVYCQFHAQKNDELSLENLSLRYFYLDKENFDRLDEEKAEAFMNGTWELLFNYDSWKKSFTVLDLPETNNIGLVKKRFKELARKYHPDMGEGNHEKFNEINRAYRLILQFAHLFRK